VCTYQSAGFRPGEGGNQSFRPCRLFFFQTRPILRLLGRSSGSLSSFDACCITMKRGSKKISWRVALHKKIALSYETLPLCQSLPWLLQLSCYRRLYRLCSWRSKSCTLQVCVSQGFRAVHVAVCNLTVVFVTLLPVVQ
jgi:hypothetical protein